MLSGRTSKLKLPPLLGKEDPVEWSWHLFLHTWEAARDDQHQMDFEVQEDVAMTNSKLQRKKGGRRRKSVLVRHAESTDEDDDDDEEFVEGFAE